MLKADFHIHSAYSMDCTMPLEEIISRCLATGINCIAISDHGTVEGALKMQRLAPFPVIVAEEILTPHGEIMGMFLKEGIPSGLSVPETLARIKAQGALACLPHPFDPLRGFKLDNTKMDELAKQIDVIEVFNARCPFPWCSTKARDFAAKHSIPGTASTDSHSPQEIGSTYTEMPEFQGKADFLQALSKAKFHQHRSSPLVHFNSTWAKLKRLF